MITRLKAWYKSLRWWKKALIIAPVALFLLGILYVAGRSVQYIGASKGSAGIFAPDGADVTVRVADAAGSWKRIQETDFWRTLKKKLLKDPAVRTQVNEILSSLGKDVPTLDQLDDVRYLADHPMVGEEFILKYAGRDVMAAVKFQPKGFKFCAATRISWGHFMLTPALPFVSGLAGLQKMSVDGLTVYKGQGMFIAIRGAVVVASNDLAFLREALRERGVKEAPPVPVSVTVAAEPIKPFLVGFPAGGFLTFADLESLRQVKIEADVVQSDLVVEVQLVGAQPYSREGAPNDIVRMIPANGIGAVVCNVEGTKYWNWVKGLSDPANRTRTELDKFAYYNFREFIDYLNSNRLGEQVISKLDGPVSVIFGASEGGKEGLTYASAALYLRSTDPRGAADALQKIIDKAMAEIPSNNRLIPSDVEIGGYPIRCYSLPKQVIYSNFLSACFAVTSDALVIANSEDFIKSAMGCLANQNLQMMTQLPYETAIRRLQQLGLKKVMGPGATASAWVYGSRLREGFEGFYELLADRTIDYQGARGLLRKKLEQDTKAEGQTLSASALDDLTNRVMEDQKADCQRMLRARARVLDYLKWIAFQAEPYNDGMRLDLAVELR